jgi:tetratricopeptide (TPR) repeat protein
MTRDTRPTVSRRHLVRALLGRDVLPDRPRADPSAPTGAGPETSPYAAADAAYAAGDYAAAIPAYRAIVRGDLSNAVARVRLGHALYELGQPIQARVEFEHVLRLTGGSDRLARLGLGLAFLALGKRERAAATLAAYVDAERPELAAAAAAAARELAGDGEADLPALRQGLDSLARATALLPERFSA